MCNIVGEGGHRLLRAALRPDEKGAGLGINTVIVTDGE